MKKFKLFFVWFLLLVQLFSISESRCPSPCKCDLVNGNQKRVHCDLADSSQAAPLDSIDMDVDILEITPVRSGSRNAYGPVLPPDFGDFHRLSKLVIKNNGIQSIPTATARQLSQLTSLDLTGNGVKNLADLSLTNFRQLSVLTLAENQIGALSVGSGLEALTSLQNLNLADNQIVTVASNALRSQSFLRVLDLHNNEIQQLSNDFVGSIGRVERLDLRGNQLMNLPRGTVRKSLTFVFHPGCPKKTLFSIYYPPSSVRS